MKQMDLFVDWLHQVTNIKDINNTKEKLPVSEQKNLTSRKIERVLSWIFHYKFNYAWYNCYEIEVKNWKIKRVKFSIWEHKFQIYINYECKKENKKIINYTETNKDDRENIIEKIIINNLCILAIQKKVKVWYWQVIKNINYFGFAWLENSEVISFLKALIQNFHK